MRQFIVYGTSACHLCEIAEEMLQAQRRAGSDFAFDTVDISESDALFERYGVLIPVLQHPDGRELHWPFAPEQLKLFLTS